VSIANILVDGDEKIIKWGEKNLQNYDIAAIG
jgi:hypothetical protein